ncbi:MAG: YkgJ family cysteine cluster protein [Desulfuromonas thiophila]|nr:YkgJ family cysteine cluster protein [Desulfuromonas thiophila]MDY0398342.1 YkgJ family cysteine cluster protein [Desulfuromonas thiophila]
MPAVSHQLSAQARSAHQLLDAIIGQWRNECASQGSRLYCQPGCAGCCSLQVQASWAEALLLAEALTETEQRQLRSYVRRLLALACQQRDYKQLLAQVRQQLGSCPFLAADDRCAHYARRPLACRALYATREPHYCTLDFSRLSSAEKQTFMASLNRRLVDFPTHYAAAPRQFAASLEQQLLQHQQQWTGHRLLGNLPLLVCLASRSRLRAALQQHATGWLARLQRRWPLLLSANSNPASADPVPRQHFSP